MSGTSTGPEIIHVPTLGEPAWQGDLTDWKIEQIISGLLVPNQSLAKALALEIRRLRAQLKETTT